MELLFDLPPWATTRDRGWATYAAPDHSLRFVVAPLVERPLADVRQLLSHALPAGARVDVLAESTGRARVGWAMTTATVRIVDEAGEVERRYVAIYQVLWMVGAIMVMGRAVELERQRDLIERVLPSGRPRLRSVEPACVAEWFELEAA
ncbi:MAG: hypothetical protein K8W52_26940 [Deltaproteobacteria bacterium]|nr:hypothetical protein [Deltaproteobacteria bacterium]